MAKQQKKVKRVVRAIPKEKKAGPGAADTSKAAETLLNRGPRDHAMDKALNRGIGGPSAKAPRRAH